MSLNSNCHSIDSFIKSFNGGTRTNRFRIVGNIGRQNAGTQVTPFHIRTASLPEAILGNVPINYRGRTVNYPGDRAYKPWEITVLDDTGTSAGLLYKAFHDWHNQINNHDSNQTVNTNSKTHFATDWNVQQYDTNGANPIKEFILKNCWPIGIGQLPLSMNEDNQLGAFSVTMLFSHYTVTTIK
jgi:hypothetical protein